MYSIAASIKLLTWRKGDCQCIFNLILIMYSIAATIKLLTWRRYIWRYLLYRFEI